MVITNLSLFVDATEWQSVCDGELSNECRQGKAFYLRLVSKLVMSVRAFSIVC